MQKYLFADVVFMSSQVRFILAQTRAHFKNDMVKITQDTSRMQRQPVKVPSKNCSF